MTLAEAIAATGLSTEFLAALIAGAEAVAIECRGSKCVKCASPVAVAALFIESVRMGVWINGAGFCARCVEGAPPAPKEILLLCVRCAEPWAGAAHASACGDN